MGTWNGVHEDLEFTCGSCGNVRVIIDLFNKEDKDKLWKWLQSHSAVGGKYYGVSKPLCSHIDCREISTTKEQYGEEEYPYCKKHAEEWKKIKSQFRNK